MDISFARARGLTFKLERDGIIIKDNIKGIFCGSKFPNTIQILGNYGVKDGDWLIELRSNKRCFVEDLRPINNDDFMAKYKTELEMKHIDNLSKSIYINQNNSQAVIGNNSNLTINHGMSFEEIRHYLSEQQITKIDKEELEQLIATVEDIVNNNKTISKGMFNKFLKFTDKYSSLITIIMQPLLNYIFCK